MPRERKTHFDVISDLKKLSSQADSIIEENDQSLSSGLYEWFEAAKNHITLIKNCNSIAEINEVSEGPILNSFLGETFKTKKVTTVPEIQREHVHSSVSSENEDKVVEKAHAMPAICISPIETHDTKDSVVIINTPASSKMKTQLRVPQTQVCTPLIINITNMSVSKSNNSTKTLGLVETPVLNRTFSKTLNKTLILDSDVCDGNGTITMNSAMKTVKIKPSNDAEEKGVSSGMMTRSGKKRKSTDSVKKVNKKSKTDTPSSHNKTPCNKIIQSIETRSSAKRKSAGRKSNKFNKKTKINASSSRSESVNKQSVYTQPKFPVANKNSKAVPSVIMPTLKQKNSVVSKEQQILEELKKKEEKAKENIKRVLTERQMKAELNKKAREEKQSKTLQKRIQIKKEKEERLEKREIEVKTAQGKIVKESVPKTRTQELIDQHISENKSVASVSKHSEACTEMPKTPANRKSSDYENYELTPLPNSSTYNFSDDEEEDKPQGKFIPPWAQGVQLKSALMEQFYNPIDADELFGTVIDPPSLIEIFGANKKHYAKRTSSAVWNSPPMKFKK